MTRRRAIVGASMIAALGSAGAALRGLRASGSMSDYNASVMQLRRSLGQNASLLELIRYATLAPSGHNTQPWRFYVKDERIALWPDFTRRTPVVDPDDHHLFVSLGCAAENFLLAASASGRACQTSYLPERGGRIEFQLTAGKQNGRLASLLFSAIPHRQSTRGDYDGQAVSLEDLKLLSAASIMPGVDTVLLTERSAINRVRDLILAGNSAQMKSSAFIHELKKWLRFNPPEALDRGDGLFSVCSGNPSLPSWAGPLMFVGLVSARSENDRYAAQLNSSSGVAVFVAEHPDHEHWTRVGRACQRFALQATALGLKCAFVNQPVEVASLRPELASSIGMPGKRPDIVMRFGRGKSLPFSARRAISSVLV
jgi:hypothetical protein